MDSMTVTDKPQLVAALKAGSRETFELAKENPFEVRLGRATYTFKEGLHERRAKAIIREVHRTPAAAFKSEPDRLPSRPTQTGSARSQHHAGQQPVAQVWSD